MTNLPVSGQVLVWARTERGLNLSEAAERLGIPETELQELENESRQPTVGELRNMAAKYEIGFSALLMPEPLPDETRLKVRDFRTHLSAREKWNPELLAEMDDINVMIDAVSDLRASDPDLLTPRFPNIAVNAPAESTAKSERERVGLSFEKQTEWTSPAVGFRRLRALIESQGILIYVINVSTTDDWRGLAICDDRSVPVIVINGAESEPAARSFTLLHEYAHILRRESAISNQRSRAESEVFCNKFAAFFLMPRTEFRRAAHQVGGGYRKEWSDTQLRKIGTIFRTSMSAVALHLETLDLAPDGFFMMKRQEWRVRQKPTVRRKIVVPYYEKITNRLGTGHVRLVFEALDRGRINQLDAYELLDVQAANFPKLRSEVEEQYRRHGWR